MTRVTLEEKFINYVRNSVDLTVGNTGFPVLGKHLIEAGITSKNKLKVLEKRGHLISIKVKADKGTVFKAYYTEREVPKWVQEQELRKKSEPSEDIHKELTSEE